VERISIAVDGAGDSAGSTDLEALAEWFAAEPELRGSVKTAPVVPGPGELGAVADVLVATLGAGGAVSVLAASLKAFFSQPRGAKVRIVLTRTDGSRIELDADRVKVASVPELTAQLVAADRAGASVPAADES
jgi:hypothetical protein